MTRHTPLALLLLLTAANLAQAWWVKGHESIARAAAAGLPDDVPAFFRAGARELAHGAGDPDRWKNPACKHLRAAEAPDHYIDLEDYQGHDLPEDRYQAIALLIKLKQKPEKVGMLPYAILENYDRLSCAFYDFRKAKEKGEEVEAIKAKCLVYAGILAHLTGDSVMPLHTTRDFDGKKDKDDKVVQKGIHARIDAFPERFGLTPDEMGRGLKAKPIDDVWAHVVKSIRESHTHVGRCYELDAKGVFEKPTDEARKFILERCQAGTQLTMDLWYSAWLRSAKMPAHY